MTCQNHTHNSQLPPNIMQSQSKIKHRKESSTDSNPYRFRHKSSGSDFKPTCYSSSLTLEGSDPGKRFQNQHKLFHLSCEQINACNQNLFSFVTKAVASHRLSTHFMASYFRPEYFHQLPLPQRTNSKLRPELLLVWQEGLDVTLQSIKSLSWSKSLLRRLKF